MAYCITVLPAQQNIEAAPGENLYRALCRAGLMSDAPCGGRGTCGKCAVTVNGEKVLACQTVVDRDMTVVLPEKARQKILTDGVAVDVAAGEEGLLLAVDIGTTTVAGYLLDGATGARLAADSLPNPQVSFGADVISRIQFAIKEDPEVQTRVIRQALETLTVSLCQKAQREALQIRKVCIVGNPAMQQLFLGISPENLAKIPFAAVLTQGKTVAAEEFSPLWRNAQMLIVPDISGFVGADTVACMLATEMDTCEEMTLLVDIGTNAEMVLGNRHRRVACAAAAGPALEGARIEMGMRGQTGAIDHVIWENGSFRCSVLGGGEAKGICGSGLIDAAAAALEAGMVNERGRVETEDRRIALTEGVYLTQEDIRQLQLAKGAISAGIRLMARQMGIGLDEIDRVYLAGAFGTFMDAVSACRIGLLPAELTGKITAIGNAAGSGAMLMAADNVAFARAQKMASETEFLELAALDDFQWEFAMGMRFPEEAERWLVTALEMGFSHGVVLDTETLIPRQDVRDMCVQDKCRAYGKNWTCPPHCGTLEECAEKLQEFDQGILLQTVGKTEKTVDTKAYRRTEEQHLKLFHAISEKIRKEHPNALCLGAGGCRICGECAWPEPCRFPEKACASMEGYGLFVTQVCKENGLMYHHGERTVTYTACILF